MGLQVLGLDLSTEGDAACRSVLAHAHMQVDMHVQVQEDEVLMRMHLHGHMQVCMCMHKTDNRAVFCVRGILQYFVDQ